MSRFLLALWDGGGVVPPELAVLRALKARGHAVRVLADPTVADEARAAGVEHVSWRTAPHRTSRDREHDILRDYAFSNPLKYYEEMLRVFLRDPGPRWVDDTLGALDEWPADVLLADVGLPWPLIAGELRGVPTATLMSNIYALPVKGAPPPGTGWMPLGGPLGAVRNAAMRWVTGRLFDRALPAMQAERARRGLPPVSSALDQFRRADRVLILSSPVFDFSAPALPPMATYVGPVLDDPSWCAPWAAPWDDGDARPLVVVAFSSTWQGHASLLQRIVSALSALPVRAVVTQGPAVRDGEVVGTANVRVVSSAPHGPLFSQAALVLTHAGHGCVIKALAAGVPVLCFPIGRDQPDNAARVVHASAGGRLTPKASAATIRVAVERLLHDQHARAAAARVGQRLRSREGCTDAVEVLERLCRPATRER